MDRNNCIKRRMLYAAARTYPFDAPGVGWKQVPVVIERDIDLQLLSGRQLSIEQKIDRALVGEIDKGIVIAFRGTLAPRPPRDEGALAALLDWLNNGACLCKKMTHYEGGVHFGFARSVDALWAGPDGIEAQVEKLRAGNDAKTIYITGHSKGGALAALAGWRAKQRWPRNPIKVLTIAGARPGDGDFAAAFAAAGIDCLRYEAELDIVPFVPPGADCPTWLRQLLNRLHPSATPPPAPKPGLLGKVRSWFGGSAADGSSVGYVGVGRRILDHESAGEWFARLEQRIATARAGGRFEPTIVDSHLITTGSRYDALVCEPGCTHIW